MFLIKKEETKTHKIYKFLSLSLKLRKRNTNNVYLVDKTGKKRKVRRIKGLKIKFAGCNSSVIIHSPIIKFKELFIKIGNHVWLAKDVSVLKGGVIADNTIVAANSIVAKPLNEEYAMYAGTPAVKKKDNLQWFVEGILDYKKHKNIN